jgi:TolB protein
MGGEKMMAKTNHLGALAAAAGTLVAVGLLLLMLLVIDAQPAGATFPGKNGKIAYASFDILPGGARTDREIYTINPTGGTPFQVTNNERQDTNPSYSPDGRKIAYAGFDGGTDSDIFTINATGGTPFNVTNNNTFDESPSYSPNANKIAYAGFDGTDWEIYKINATGGTPIQLTNNDKNDQDPDYSPNGEKIAYTHCLIPVSQQDPDRSCAASDQPNEADYTEIFTINATGGTPFNVTNNNTWDAWPSYSPNGRKIAYAHSDGDGTDSEIYKIHHNGGTPVRVTNNDSSDGSPSWGSRP